MSDAELLSRVIGEIYDTTLDPARWVGALETITGFMHGTASVLASEDIGGGPGSFYYSWGDDQKYSELYRAKYANINPSVVVAHILSLTSGARKKTGHLYRAAVAMFVHKATLHRPTLIEAVATQFKLTPSELRVLFAIIEVGGAPQVANVLGIALDTVKTHLKRVFAKTGTNRQVDLVKLIVGYMNPLI
jgi:DNA-binding CsgD family transcriptional regulator